MGSGGLGAARARRRDGLPPRASRDDGGRPVVHWDVPRTRKPRETAPPQDEPEPQPEPESSSASGILQTILSVVGLTRDLLLELYGKVEGMVEELGRRLIRTLLSALFLFTGAVLLLLGVLFLFIDFAGAPRGVVFSVGGLIILLVSIISIQSSRRKT